MGNFKKWGSLIVLLTGIHYSMLAQTTEFEQMVNERSLNKRVEDCSMKEQIAMDEPKMAYVNLTGFTNMPTSKSMTMRGWMEVYDGNGIYFKKPVIISAQGSYSLKFPKRNFVCHYCNDMWDEDKGVEVKIGKWVKQDSFHFKAFYTDFLRGIGEIGYKVFEEVVADRAPYWERGGYHDDSKGRCFPDGFPCAVYLNGKFYGVFAWQLKKSRKNMNMKKDVAEHIHLDGALQNKSIFRGVIIWRDFEVRNPKGLYDRYGNKYNGDTPRELIDEECDDYDNETDTPDIRQAKVMTSKVKAYIIQMSKYFSELSKMEKDGSSKEEMREEIEKRYEIESLIDYCVFFYFQANGDGSLKNWQWFTYDGKKWMVTPYDLDQTFGINLYGAVRPATLGMDNLMSGPFYWIHKYYQEDLRERYKELRDRGVFDAEFICRIIDDWYERVGEEYYTMEKAQWPNSPCYRNAVCNQGWEVYNKWANYSDTENYDANQLYHTGDIVKLEGRLWKATQTVQGVRPYIVNANIDTLERLHGWVRDRIDYMDNFYAYTPIVDAIEDVTSQEPVQRLIGIYNTSGMHLEQPQRGINIYQYSDGTTKKVLIH